LKVGIIGSGLGGSLSGVSLAKKRHKVTIFEKLPYSGGRFTNLTYLGFELSTGALHMIPHGANGPLGQMLKNLSIDVEIIPSNPPGAFRINGEDYLYNEVPELFSLKEKLQITRILADLKFGSGGDESYKDWLKKRIKNQLIFDIADSFCGWALSLDSDDISSRELISMTKNIRKFGVAGIPKGGCKGITSALTVEFENLGGQILYKTPVDSILIEDGKVMGLSTEDESFDFDVVLSDIGPKATIELCGEENFDKGYVKAMKNIKEVGGPSHRKENIC
jgi:phytoene dehydrogenase-like protein